MGDSHAAQYMPAFQKLADQNQWQLTVFEKAACPLTDIIIRFQETGDIKSDCQSWKSQVIDIISTDRPDLVVVAGGLPNIYRGYYWLPNDQEITTGYANVWQSLKEQSISILVIRDNPRPIIDIPSCVASNRTNVELCSRLKSEVLDNHFDPLVEAAKIADVSLLDLTDFFCVAEKCPAVIGNTLVYRDGDHLTASFARSLAPYIDISIQLLLQTKKPSAETL
ncbi:MAG: hypothetical protein H3C43_14195 [Leptonema sp. (in: Bacteria)]|nr:hypothetical protein [Leptonema sp. (in: bacteria)]